MPSNAAKISKPIIEKVKPKKSIQVKEHTVIKFFLHLLDEPTKYEDTIKWMDDQKSTFRVINPTEISLMYSKFIGRDTDFDSMCRPIRRYCVKGLMKKMDGASTWRLLGDTVATKIPEPKINLSKMLEPVVEEALKETMRKFIGFKRSFPEFKELSDEKQIEKFFDMMNRFPTLFLDY